MSRRTWATPSARSDRRASWLMRSLPRMNLTSSVIGASLLAQPGVNECFPPGCRACVEHVPDRLLVEADQRSLPRMNLTSSVIGASLLAQPGVNECFPPGCRACVEHVPDRLLVEADQGDHNFVVGGEPADNADGDVGIKWMGNPPELVPAGLADSLEGRGLFGRLSR